MKDFFGVTSVRGYSVAADKPSLDGTSSNYVEEMYNSWLRDPASVHTVRRLRKTKLQLSIANQVINWH